MKFLKRITLIAILAALVVAFSSVTLLAQDAAQAACEAYNEAPELAERVAAGELPDVADRLPVNPVVLEPFAEIGQYGGQMFDFYNGARLAEFRQFGYENLVRWNPDGSEVIPNIAERWDVSEDGTTYTFYLREGLRWSDGELFTADDILFWWEQVETNTDINPGGPFPYFVRGGEPAVVTKIDDLTVEFKFSEPHGLFLQNLSSAYGVRVTQFAEHYLSQFSNKLNPDGVAAMMAEAGATEYGPWWVSRVGSYGHDAEYNDPERPLMQPWIPTESILGKERFTFTRNPYYFKVDTACNQLPYITERVFTLVTDPEVAVLKTIDGEDSISDDPISTPSNRAVFFDNLEAGDYRFVDGLNSNFETMRMHLRFNSPDPVQAQIIQNKDFRIGLSVALDRQAIIDTVYIGQGSAFQDGPRPESPLYNEQLSTQYLDFDVDLANEHLDRALPDKDAEGFRLRPDGQRFTFTVLANQDFRPEWVDILQFYERNWEAVGIDTIILPVANDIWRTRKDEADVDAYVWVGENGAGILPLLDNNTFTPEFADGWQEWANAEFGLGYGDNAGAEPVEPPAALQRQYEIYILVSRAASTDEQIALFQELLQISADEFYSIGLSLPAGDYFVVSNRLQNVPDALIRGWLYPGPAPVNFETFFIAGE
jgi:peptide/nickel transport system substrate-binding protein